MYVRVCFAADGGVLFSATDVDECFPGDASTQRRSRLSRNCKGSAYVVASMQANTEEQEGLFCSAGRCQKIISDY